MALLLCSTATYAQFNPNANAAGTMRSAIDNMVDTTEYEVDSTVRQFTIKRFVKSLAHKDSMTLGASHWVASPVVQHGALGVKALIVVAHGLRG